MSSGKLNPSIKVKAFTSSLVTSLLNHTTYLPVYDFSEGKKGMLGELLIFCPTADVVWRIACD